MTLTHELDQLRTALDLMAELNQLIRDAIRENGRLMSARDAVELGDRDRLPRRTIRAGTAILALEAARPNPIPAIPPLRAAAARLRRLI